MSKALDTANWDLMFPVDDDSMGFFTGSRFDHGPEDDKVLQEFIFASMAMPEKTPSPTDRGYVQDIANALEAANVSDEGIEQGAHTPATVQEIARAYLPLPSIAKGRSQKLHTS